MTTFPTQDLPNTTLTLILSLNFLKIVTVIENLPKLKYLDLSRNGIEELEPRAFDYCTALEVIDLSWNLLAHFPSDIFKQLAHFYIYLIETLVATNL